MEILYSEPKGSDRAGYQICPPGTMSDSPPPFTRSRCNLETIVKSIDTYLSRGSFEERLAAWLRAPASPEDPQDPAGAGLSDVADLLLEESNGEGIIPAALERNRQIKSLLGYQDEI